MKSFSTPDDPIRVGGQPETCVHHARSEGRFAVWYSERLLHTEG
jgi:hypothetical protein